MYYSAIVDHNSGSDTEMSEAVVLTALSQAYGIDLTIIKEPSEELLNFVLKQDVDETPVILVGNKVVASGSASGYELVKHFKANPHVPYYGEKHMDYPAGGRHANRSNS